MFQHRSFMYKGRILAIPLAAVIALTSVAFHGWIIESLDVEGYASHSPSNRKQVDKIPLDTNENPEGRMGESRTQTKETHISASVAISLACFMSRHGLERQSRQFWGFIRIGIYCFMVECG